MPKNLKTVTFKKKTGFSVTRKNFADNLKRLINESGKTQKEIAKETGILETSISQWCSCTSFPSSEALSKICVYFDVSISDLLEEHIELNEKQEETFLTIADLIEKLPSINKIQFYDALTAYVKSI